MAQNGDEVSKPKKSESPPLPKRSKTIAGGTGTGDAHPHFPGPLFPVMRRNATLPLPPHHLHQQPPTDLRVFTGNNHSYSNGDDASAGGAGSNLNNRDWFYPSFMVPLAPKRGGTTTMLASSDSRVDKKPRRIATPEAKPEVEKKNVKVATSRASSISSARDSIRFKATMIWKPRFLVSHPLVLFLSC